MEYLLTALALLFIGVMFIPPGLLQLVFMVCGFLFFVKWLNGERNS